MIVSIPYRLSAIAGLLALSASVVAQAPAPTPAPTSPQEKKADVKPADQKPDDSKPKPKPGQPKPYKDVITAEAKSETGLFTVHRIDDKVYFEIPASALGRDMLWTTEIAQISQGAGGFGGGYGGSHVGDRVVRWTRRNNKIYLRSVDFTLRAQEKGAIDRAIEAASLQPIIMAFDVEAEGKDKSAVIEVTKLLNSDVAEFSAKSAAGGGGVDSARTYIDTVKPFPTNIESKVLYTFTGGGGGAALPIFRRGGGGASSVGALVHYSMVLLPDQPMCGRLHDSRVGYFTQSFQDYGRPEHREVDREYIARFRLEKKDPTAAVSEPVKPIVFYVSREVPEKWRPWLRKAIEDWQPAFEKAGFKHAIIAKDAPSEKDDPNWDPEDARYSVIRWAPTPTENAMGPHVHDPRSGEIISAHVIIWHNVLKLAESWYFSQVGAVDPRAKTLPLPDDLMGRILEYVVCHEVGHTLGLRHNHKASSSYTVAQLRSKAFTDKYGDEASIMDYGRFNYVAQPGDNANLIPVIGPYDEFAIEWGYKPIPGAKNCDDEKTILDTISARQMTNPMLRFGGEDMNAMSDPSVQTEDLGSDPVAASRYGLMNIRRVMKMLVPATTKFGENYDLLEEMYDAVLGQRRTELSHVVKLVGGVVQTDYHAGRGAAVYNPVPKAKQAEAVKFLVDNAFQTPTELLDPSILQRIEPAGVADRVLNSQVFIVNSLLTDTRIKRMEDCELLHRGDCYTVSQLVSDVQNGIWGEVAQPHPAISVYRRNLQRAYLNVMKARLVGDAASQTDLRPIAIGALRQLVKQIDSALPHTSDRVTGLHLADCRKQIERILDPKT